MVCFALPPAVSKISHILYNSLLTPVLNVPQKQTKKKAKKPKFKISQFFIQLWKRPSLGVCMNFGEQICCALSDKMSFFPPHGPMLTKTKKKKNWQKSKISNFANFYTTLVDTLPRSMHNILGVNLSLCTFRGYVVFSQIWPHVNVNEEKIVKNQTCKNFKHKKNGLEIR